MLVPVKPGTGSSDEAPIERIIMTDTETTTTTTTTTKPLQTVRHTCPARVGLLGNPSDGYNGQTISFLVDKFAAEVGETRGDG